MRYLGAERRRVKGARLERARSKHFPEHEPQHREPRGQRRGSGEPDEKAAIALGSTGSGHAPLLAPPPPAVNGIQRIAASVTT